MKTKVLGGAVLLTILISLISGRVLLQEQISVRAYRSAFAALDSYRSIHPEERPRFLAVVDYSKPSYLKRMALIDLQNGKQSFYLVAHGINSGELNAKQFSNTRESNMSSLGLYKALDTYNGDHGKAIRLAGLDPAMNSNAFTRDIVLHSADYVSLRYIMLNLITFNGPRIGRSNGCLVVSPSNINEISQKLGNKAFLYVWAEKP